MDAITKIYDEVIQADCECCGQKEDCTKDYIVIVKNNHAGSWVCGLCSGAIEEYLSKNPGKTMEEAVSSHNEVCQNFNITTRINPKLTLAWALKDIAKRSLKNRMVKNSTKLNIYRSSSCIPTLKN
ncbi:hypothetical protein L1987_00101 [Smallanthus sonchifolius]|uniref:Uncharacterized protein n=1 Tax=Smallanthus sonchifolius TaxID=185202 RepID=A0ACB9K1B5_9ASTR|nr:hypothetical protein L1987_00101 [Smallanthus sonchifolius]